MSWLNPLAFAFLALVPVIIILHTLRHRRRDVQVSTLFLWERVLRETHGTLGFRRLIQNLPLILQILLVLLLTAGLAQPALRKIVPENKDIVLVLDVSASMQTHTSQGTRFAQARQRALEVLQGLPRDRQMAIIAADRQPRVLTFFTTEKAILQQAILEAEVSDAPGNMRDAVLLALSFAQGEQSLEVVVVGDGAYGPLSELDFPRQQIRHVRIGGGERNVGIVRLAFRKLLTADEYYEALITVKNFSAQAIEAPLRLTLRNRTLLERQVNLEPGKAEVVVAVLKEPPTGVAQADLLIEDDFPLDNRAYGVLEDQTQVWLLLVGESNFFLERLLTSLPNVQVNVIPEVSEDSLPHLRQANHVILFNGVQPPPLYEGNYVLINALPADQRFHQQGSVTAPHVLDWRRDHPLLRYVDWTDVRIETARAVQVSGGVQPLVDGSGTTLLSVLEEPRLRVVTLAFDLMQSDLPLRVAFPVFMNNLLRWFTPLHSEYAAGQVQPGTPQAIFFDLPVERVTVQGPQDTTREYPVQGNPWIFSDTSRIGVYIIRAGEQKRYLTVSLLDEIESNINPADALPDLTPTAAAAARQAGIVETPLWPYVLLGAVLVLMGEWYVW